MAARKKKIEHKVLPKKVDAVVESPAKEEEASQSIEAAVSTELTSDQNETQVPVEEPAITTETEEFATPKESLQEDALPVEKEDQVVTKENTKQETQENNEVPLEQEDGKRKLFKKIIIWSGIALVIGVVIGVSCKLAYERGIAVGEVQIQERQEKEVIKQKEVVVSPTSEEVKKSTFTIEVLNGSGISGEAARVKALLEKEGFTVSTVGNASKSDVEETTIQAKSSVSKAWIELVKKSLGESLMVSALTSLEDEKATDVVITVGSKKVE